MRKKHELNPVEFEALSYGALCLVPEPVLVSRTAMAVKSQLLAEQNIQEIISTSSKDALTGLFNKSEIRNYTLQWMSEDRQFGVLLADLANFKKLNDQLGHIAGDEYLQDTANIIRYALRTDDEVGRITAREHEASRWGGDEFVMLVDLTPDSDKVMQPLERLEVIADRLTNLFFDFLETSDLAEMGLGITIGYAVFDPLIHFSPDDLFNEADQHMFSQKESGHTYLGGAYRT